MTGWCKACLGSYQLGGLGVRLHRQAAVSRRCGGEWLQPLPQFFSDEGHERGQQCQRHRHAVEEDGEGLLTPAGTGLSVVLDPRPLLWLCQDRFYTLLQHTENPHILVTFPHCRRGAIWALSSTSIISTLDLTMYTSHRLWTQKEYKAAVTACSS